MLSFLKKALVSVIQAAKLSHFWENRAKRCSNRWSLREGQSYLLISGGVNTFREKLVFYLPKIDEFLKQVENYVKL